MKRILLMCMAACLFNAGFAQEEKKETNDTIRIGGMVIIKKPGSEENEVISGNKNYKIPNRKKKPENLTTNWGILDFGSSGFNDQTNYMSNEAQEFAPGSNEDWFEQKLGKSRNINIWFFMQRLNVIKHVVNLKYGAGLELNNYFFDDVTIRFNKNPTLVTQDNNLVAAKKNKIAADYFTVPMMINFNFTPERRDGFGLSAGVSAGYLYSARQKVKTSDDKVKSHDDFDLRPWKISYVAELLLGPIKFYGSYALESMWEKGLDQTPYNVGFRLSSW